MTIPVDDPRQLLATLEAQADSQDRLMRRLQDNLRDMIDAREELEELARLETHLRATRTSFIVEAAILLREQRTGERLMFLTDLESGDVITLSSRRRPKLRVVQ